MAILLLDNYDSFTFNLLHILEKLSEDDVTVIRNDKIKIEDIAHFSSVVLSPGPGLPSTAGIMPQLITRYFNKKKILGVCLGMQAIGEHFGTELKNLTTVIHGEAHLLNIKSNATLFKNCPPHFLVGRYHSWVLNRTTLSSELEIIAEDADQEIMAIKHRELPIYGVQFHPESILSQYGEIVIKNWLSL